MTDEIKEVRLWTAEDVCVFLKLKNEETVYRWVKRGLIPHVRLGRFIRFRPADIHALAENGLPEDGDAA